MPQERFITANVLPPELVDRIQRKVRAAYLAVQDDPQQIGIVTVRFVIEPGMMECVDGRYTLKSEFADRANSEMGKIRDGQMVLPGTGVLSDSSTPSQAWVNQMVGEPAGVK